MRALAVAAGTACASVAGAPPRSPKGGLVGDALRRSVASGARGVAIREYVRARTETQRGARPRRSVAWGRIPAAGESTATTRRRPRLGAGPFRTPASRPAGLANAARRRFRGETARRARRARWTSRTCPGTPPRLPVTLRFLAFRRAWVCSPRGSKTRRLLARPGRPASRRGGRRRVPTTPWRGFPRDGATGACSVGRVLLSLSHVRRTVTIVSNGRLRSLQRPWHRRNACAVASGAPACPSPRRVVLSFSNCGEYVCAAHARDGFTVWETEGWRSAFWGTEGRAVTAVAWGPRGGLGPGEGPPARPTPRGATALVAVEGGGARLSAAHFSRGAPSLVAQVLPVDLPRAVLPERPFSGGTLGGESVSRGAGGDRRAGNHPKRRRATRRNPPRRPTSRTCPGTPPGEGWRWPSRMRRRGPMFPAGAVGLFSTRLAPVIRASLVGGIVTAGATFANHGSDERGGNALAAAPRGPRARLCSRGPGGAAGCRAPGDAAEAATTLAACWEGGRFRRAGVRVTRRRVRVVVYLSVGRYGTFFCLYRHVRRSFAVLRS